MDGSLRDLNMPMQESQTAESLRAGWARLRRAAVLSLVVHFVAGLAMAVVLRHGLETNPDLSIHRIAVMMTGYLANGLYTLATVLAVWATRRSYASWIWTAGLAVGVFGFALSASALADSIAGLFWTNAGLVPATVVWQVGVVLRFVMLTLVIFEWSISAIKLQGILPKTLTTIPIASLDPKNVQ